MGQKDLWRACHAGGQGTGDRSGRDRRLSSGDRSSGRTGRGEAVGALTESKSITADWKDTLRIVGVLGLTESTGVTTLLGGQTVPVVACATVSGVLGVVLNALRVIGAGYRTFIAGVAVGVGQAIATESTDF